MAASHPDRSAGTPRTRRRRRAPGSRRGTRRPSPLAALGAVAAMVGLTAPVGVAHDASHEAHAHARPDGGDETHTVRRGDTLGAIARELGVSVDGLVSANDLADPDHIVVGRRLRVPVQADAPGPTPGHHVVGPGETLSAIAARYGLDLQGLAAANGLTDADRVWAGSRLRLTDVAPRLPTPDRAATVEVRPGDTLSAIAARHGTSVAALARANDLTDPDRVIAGTILTVPGGWRCPVDGAAAIVNDYGVPKGGGRFHNGIDLFAPRGTPVVATVDGIVEHRTGDRGGRQAILHGADGHRYVGTHLADFGAAGRVQAGSVIGYVGDTGNAAGTSPHLHFEVHPDGGPPVNPYPLLQRACIR